ncbi:MAG TPA: inositol monophosphatase family protein [Candidatus Saccharimonadales bacterium]|nr:inositol monophosphatase family protein [Candidatus Saccharimonadales bacterium]
MPPEPQDLLDAAAEAARAGAAVILRAHGAGTRVDYESKTRNDFVTDVDRGAEAAIVAVIRKRFPDHAILAEEAGRTLPGTGFRWIIDPLDGTTNFIHGYPVFGVSVAASEIRGGAPAERLDPADLVAGVVLDPLRGETFTATRGGGARLNGKPLRVSGARELRDCLLATGFPFRLQDLLGTYLEIFADLHQATQGIRRPGSASLDLASVAAGRADGFFEFGLSPWDMAAGTLLVTEAGGVARGFTGGTDFLETGHIVAGPPAITEKILEVVARHYP